MKVKELIEILKYKDPEALVMDGVDGFYDISTVDDVDVVFNFNKDEPWMGPHEDLELVKHITEDTSGKYKSVPAVILS